MYRIGVRDRQSHERVSGLVVGDTLLFGDAHDSILLFESQHNSIDRLFYVVHFDTFALASSGKECSLIHNVGEVGAGHARCSRGDLTKIRTRAQC